MAYLILDEVTQQYLAEEYDAENIAMAAANRHARETGHDASVWVGDRDNATNTGYYAEAAKEPELTREDKILLGRLTTNDDAGRHFTSTHDSAWLDRMEAAGYITIDRPVHAKTSIPYSLEYWSVEVSPQVAEWFDDRGNLIESQYGGVRLGDLGVSHVWFVSVGQPAGCDLISEDGEPLELPSEDWWDLTGEIIDNQWQWDGEGNPTDFKHNTVQKITAFVPEG
jgi:hypothetical protein